MKSFALVALILFTNPVFGDWFCTEAASERISERLYHACGAATASNESAARRESLEEAFSEFNKLCNASSTCRGKETEVLPKRTDCKKSKEGSYICYRMIEVVVLRHDRKAINIDESEIDAEISKKLEELSALHSKLSKVVQLKRLEVRAEELKELERKTEEAEVDLVNLEFKLNNAPMYMDTTSPWSGSIFITHFQGPIEERSESQFGFGFETRRRLSNWLSVGGGISYISDFNEKEVSSTGPANGTSSFPQKSDGWLVNVDLGVQYKKLRLGPMFSYYF